MPGSMKVSDSVELADLWLKITGIEIEIHSHPLGAYAEVDAHKLLGLLREAQDAD